MDWDPRQYERFAGERARPFADLVARIPAAAPDNVVDLGCGPGTVTATLCQRWPRADVLGIDSSPDMIASAQRHRHLAGSMTEDHDRDVASTGRGTGTGDGAGGQLRFELGDIATWAPAMGTVDVIVTNAALQWVPDHLRLLPHWAAALRPGGSLAIQVPVPAAMAADDVIKAVVTEQRWSARLAEAGAGAGPRAVSPVRPAGEYVAGLAALGLAVDVWTTTYWHVLAGADPVLEWFAGTGLRPYLHALGGDEQALGAFRDSIAERLRVVYPPQPFGTVLPFPRLFAVATKS